MAVSLVVATATSSFAQTTCTSSKDLFINPFNKNSAFHRPIGTGAQYAPDSHQMTRDWLKGSSLALNVGGPWGVDVARVSASDPRRQVTARSPGRNLPASVRFPAGGFNTPRNSGGHSDNLTFIYDTSEGRAYELFGYNWNGGNPSAMIMWNWDIRGLGHGSSSGQRVGSTAAGIAAAAGLLRGDVINRAGAPVEHALQIGLPSNPGCKIMLSRQIILPATTRDAFATNSGYNTGSIPYGANVALPRSVNVDGLGLSEPGRRLARALQNYGAYVVDTAGCGGGALRTDQFVNGSVRSQLASDMPKIYRHMRVVLNSEWKSGQTATGGGQPIAPNCAFDAGATNVASQPQSSTNNSSSSGGSTTSNTQQSSNNPPANQQPANTSGNREPAAGTAAADNWSKAKQFYQWAMWDKATMERTRPGTAEHQRAKEGYERNSRLYVEHAAKAGIKVTIDVPPDRAIASNNSGTTNTASSGSSSSQQQASNSQPANQVPATGSTSAKNKPPAAGTAAADNWNKAKQFYQWAMWDKTTMERTRPGTPEHKRASDGYERNGRLYVEHAAKAGIKVTIDIPPDRAFA